MFDFPAPATNGQTIALGGVVWTFDGTKWTASPNTTAWAPLSSPVFTGDPQAPTAALGDADTSVATTAFTQTAINAAGGRGNVGRNLLHNSMFNVQQRGAGPWTTTGYTADRWFAWQNIDTISVNIGALVDADRTAFGDESARYAAVVQATGSATAGAFTAFAQWIEGVRRLSGKTVTVSLWARATAGTPRLGLSAMQSFGTGGSPSATLYAPFSPGSTAALTTTWTRYTASVTLPSTAGKTLGTSGSDASGLVIVLSDQANAFGTGIGVQSGTVQLWGVQLEIGSVATPLEKPDPRLDLANCQRFYFASPVYALMGYAQAGGYFGQTMLLPVTMRATPTIALGTPTYTNSSAQTADNVSTGSLRLWATVTSATNAGLNTSFTASADL